MALLLPTLCSAFLLNPRSLLSASRTTAPRSSDARCLSDSGDETRTGVVKWFNNEKGFGAIAVDGDLAAESLRVHHSQITHKQFVSAFGNFPALCAGPRLGAPRHPGPTTAASRARASD